MELILIACLMSAPDHCETHRLRLTIDGVSPVRCMYASPPRVARWQALHRKWRVKSWSCAVAGAYERI